MTEQFIGANTEASKAKALDDLHARIKQDWQEVSRADLIYYLESADSLALPPGKLIYPQGADVDILYLLISGTVEELRIIDTGKGEEEFFMREVSAGAWLGVYDLVYRNPHSTAARTRDICHLVALRAQDMHRLLHKYPILRNHLLPAAKYARLRTMPLLGASNDVQVTFVADAAEVKEYRNGESIYQAGSDADKVYLIDEGQVRLDHQDGRGAMWLGNGGEFGVGEKLSTGPGSFYPLDHNATATSQTRCFVLPRRSFYVITARNPEMATQEQRLLRREALAAVEVFRDWEEIERLKLLGYMSHYHIPSNHLLTQQGEVVDSMWILLKGKPALVLALGARGEAIPESRVRGPAYFSEDALRQQLPATSSLEAEAGSAWLRLHWQDYRRFVDRPGGADLTAKLRMPATSGSSETLGETPATTSINAKPAYDWLEHGEQVTLATRRHWTVAFLHLFPAILLSLLALGALASMAMIGEAPAWLLWSSGVTGALALLGWVWGAYDYMNDYLVVTNSRVVRQEKILLLHQMRQVAPLDKIQDVTLQQGFWANFWRYGNVEVQTAGNSENIRFDRAARYEDVAKAIKEGADKRRGHYRAVGKREIYAALENRFGLALKLPSRVIARSGMSDELHDTEDGILARWRETRRRARLLANSDERLRILWHKHWILLVWRLILPVLLMLLWLGLAVWLWQPIWAGDPLMGMVGIALLVAFAASAFFAWYRIEDWSNDLYILDKDQLIDIARKPLALEREQRTASLAQVVDIQTVVPSPIHYIFNFGTVYVQTAATEGNFDFKNVANPLQVAEIIRRRMDRNQQNEQRAAARQRAEELPDWLEAYSRLDPNQQETRATS